MRGIIASSWAWASSYPTKASSNDGASYAKQDAIDLETQSEEEEELAPKTQRPPRQVLTYVVVKRWVTGDRAKQDEDEIQCELDALMREWMELSRQLKLFYK